MEDTSQQKITLIKIIADRMNQLGWKPVELARRSGVSQPVLSRLFKGGRQIGLDNIQKILFALDLISMGTNFPIDHKSINSKNSSFDEYEEIINVFKMLSLESQIGICHDLMGILIRARQDFGDDKLETLNEGIRIISKFIEKRI